MPLNEILAPTNISNTGNVFPGFSPPQITTLTNGTFALVYVDSVDGTEAVWKIFNAQGELIETGGTPEDDINLEADPDIAALSGGGFALTWEDDNYEPELCRRNLHRSLQRTRRCARRAFECHQHGGC